MLCGPKRAERRGATDHERHWPTYRSRKALATDHAVLPSDDVVNRGLGALEDSESEEDLFQAPTDTESSDGESTDVDELIFSLEYLPDIWHEFMINYYLEQLELAH